MAICSWDQLNVTIFSIVHNDIQWTTPTANNPDQVYV